MPKSAPPPSERKSAAKPAAKPGTAAPAAKGAGSRATGGKTAVRSTPKASGGRSAGRSRAPAAEPPAQPGWWERLSPERRIDILGIILALVGFLSLLGLLSSEHGVLTRWLIDALRQTGGLGAFILPLGLMLLGVWLVLRKIDRFPTPSGERLTGLVLLYLNILTWLHFWKGGGWALAATGSGGGYIGAFFERALVGAVGGGGALILLVSWLVIAVVMTLDISVTELFNFFRGLGQTILVRLQEERELAAERQKAALEAEAAAAQRAPVMSSATNSSSEEELHRLPPDFLPLPGRGEAQPQPQAGAARRVPGGARVGVQAAGGPNEAAAAQTNPGTSRGTARPGGQQATQAQPVQPAPLWPMPVVSELLDPPTPEVVKNNADQERSKLIETTLASFGAPAHIVDVSRGPTVTQFGVEPDFVEGRSGRMRVRVSKIVGLADDLALALAASRIRIQAPVPGRSYVGIEVPNSEISRVMLREVIESEDFQKKRSPMRFAIGKDVSGKSVSYDLAGMPHLLIAGTTGSGKSVCVNSLLSCLLLHNSPSELRLILVDPKRVELTGYNGIPHLLAPVIVEAERVVGALQWVQREMDARYHRFSQVGARNIQDYNKKNSPPLPYLLVLIDELADLMMLAPDETERSLTRLAQLARATGIHLVLATQRPSVDVVTGLIKANFPSRIAFAVASGVDSRVILDQPGAERLLGRGDMLFQAPDSPAPVRLQGVWVSDGEIQRIIDYWRLQDYNMRINSQHQSTTASATAEPVNMDTPLSTPLQQSALFDTELGGKEGDPLFDEAVKIVRQESKASISMLQRKLRIGYTRSARLIDAMEEKGIVGPAQATSQVRPVLDMGDETNSD